MGEWKFLVALLMRGETLKASWGSEYVCGCVMNSACPCGSLPELAFPFCHRFQLLSNYNEQCWLFKDGSTVAPSTTVYIFSGLWASEARKQTTLL